MGISCLAPIDELVGSKYSLATKQSTKYQDHLTLWKSCPESCLCYPVQLYSDECYIVLHIRNVQLPIPSASLFCSEDNDTDTTLDTLRFRKELAELLHFFTLDSIEEYYSNTWTQKQFVATILVMAGDNVQAYSRAQAASQANRLYKYLAFGGYNALSKVFNDPLSVNYGYTNLNGEYEPSFSFQSMAKLASRGEISPKDTQRLVDKLCGVSLIQHLIFGDHITRKKHIQSFITLSSTLLKTRAISSKELDKRKAILKKQGHKMEPKEELDQSSPFVCEITEIDFRNEKLGGGGTFARKQNESLLFNEYMEELGVAEKFYVVEIPNTKSIIVSNYSATRNFTKLTEQKIGMIVNCSSQQCFNYFLNDFQYLSYPLLDPDQQKNPALCNMQSLLFQMTYKINECCQGQSKVAFFCNHSNYGLSGAMAVGYLMVHQHLPFEVCLQTVVKQTQSQLRVPSLYCQQLRDLEQRLKPCPELKVLGMSYLREQSHILTAKYLGKIRNMNELQLIPNYSRTAFIVIPGSCSKALQKAVASQEWDPSVRKTKCFGVKIMTGKQCHYQSFIKVAQECLCLHLLYETLAMQPSPKLSQYLKQVSSMCPTQPIQKFFRKPQAFSPVGYSIPLQGLLQPSKMSMRSYPETREQLVLKYPILRATWEHKQKDGYYFILKGSADGVQVDTYKGDNWIGYEEDKKCFFQRIVKLYLTGVNDEKIWVAMDQEKSLFDAEMSLGI